MKFLKNKKKRIWFIIISSLLALLIAVGIALWIFISDYYPADEEAIAAFAEDSAVESAVLDNGTIVYEPEDATKGFIFYPGARVEHSAYKPLLSALSEKGIFCAVVEMPMRIAFFEPDAANEIIDKYPDIESWYIGGHSLGGSMAASHLVKYGERYEGLVLLASYSIDDISSKPLRVLSVYGSEDKVMTMKNYNKNKKLLPRDFSEIIIEGGCHSQFGMYGPQKGDGKAKISATEQIELTAEYIWEFILAEDNN